MSAIPQLISQGFQPSNDAPLVTAELVAMSVGDMDDEKRVAYSQKVQAYFLPPEHIPASDEITYYRRRREQPPVLPDPVLSVAKAPRFNPFGTGSSAEVESTISPPVAAALSPPEPVTLTPAFSDVAASRPAATNRQQRQSFEQSRRVTLVKPKAQAAGSSVHVPEGHVNLKDYFQDQGIACAPTILLSLARQHRIDSRQWLSTSQGVFASESNASILALAIMEHDAAPPDTGNPEVDQVPVYRIAVEFSGRQARLSEGDVHKVAVKILQQRAANMESFATPLRKRLSDGSGGILTLHYKKWFADLVRAELKILEVQRKLASIRQW